MSNEIMTKVIWKADVLPAWTSVLVVVAHPDDESFGLGAILHAFTGAGARVEVLCLTHGEASTLHGASGDLATVREAELALAADVLGVTKTMLHDHPDGALNEVCQTRLAAEVVAVADSSHPGGVLVFDTDGVTGHLDHVAATSAALLAAEMLDLPVLGWTLPETVAAQLNQEFGATFTGHADREIDLRVTVDRGRQRQASRVHASQALPGSVLWRRLELLADIESLRWLRQPGDEVGGPALPAARVDDPEGGPLPVEHRAGSQSDINVRGDVIGFDQSVQGAGDETAPTPTQSFIASFASCVSVLCAPLPASAKLAHESPGR
jgi:N-acetylglucosamine malate deacetylase 2